MSVILSLLLAPLLVGLVNKTKAFFAGRTGASVFQLYYDLYKLIRKSSIRSTNSTWIFAVAPSLGFLATIAASAVLPFRDIWFIVFFYLLGSARFFTVLSARDVASAFPDMGSAREVQFSAMIEAIVFAILACLALSTDGSLVPRLLMGGAAFVVVLAENCRVPFDDPETHLELTMIHEAMILDNSGPSLALILYTAAIKLWLFCSFFVMILVPVPAFGVAFTVITLSLGLVIGAVESSMARMRFTRTPFVLACAFGCAVLALVMEALTK